ncbi:MAG TPA: hypothetical protein VMG09_04480 [Bacteroidota bacterium]|nr:hypothetical protein [Bacteroidota bacterium]
MELPNATALADASAQPERRLLRTRPALGLLWLLFLLVGLGTLLYFLLAQFPFIERHFPGGNVPAVAASGIILVFVLRAIDSGLEGRLFVVLAKILFWGYPTVVNTASTLPLWYEFDKLKSVPSEDLTDKKRERLTFLDNRLLGHYVEHGFESDLNFKRPFSSWMVAEVVPHYENNVEALAYFGAAFLIVVVGLRGINYITKDNPEPVILSLFIEFSLIGLLGLLKFFKPERSDIGEGGLPTVPSMNDLLRLRATVEKLLNDHQRLSTDVTSIDKGLQDLRGGLDRIGGTKRQ